MIRIKYVKTVTALFVIFTAVFLLNTCEDILTNSWGKASARDPAKVHVDASNADALLASANGNSELSRGILDKIADQIASTTNAADKAKLQKSAITAAKQGAGVDTQVLGAISNFDFDNPNAAAAQTLLQDMLDGARKNNVSGVGDNLSTILASALDSGSSPAFSSNFAETVTDADLTQVALLLVLSETSKLVDGGDTIEGAMTNYLADWTSGPKDLADSSSLSNNEKILAAAIDLLADRGNPLGTTIKNLLSSGS